MSIAGPPSSGPVHLFRRQASPEEPMLLPPGCAGRLDPRLAGSHAGLTWSRSLSWVSFRPHPRPAMRLAQEELTQLGKDG